MVTCRRWRRWRASTSTIGRTRKCTLSATGKEERSQGPIKIDTVPYFLIFPHYLLCIFFPIPYFSTFLPSWGGWRGWFATPLGLGEGGLRILLGVVGGAGLQLLWVVWGGGLRLLGLVVVCHSPFWPFARFIYAPFSTAKILTLPLSPAAKFID